MCPLPSSTSQICAGDKECGEHGLLCLRIPLSSLSSCIEHTLKNLDNSVRTCLGDFLGEAELSGCTRT